jgi:hypothetical protein
MSSGMKNTITLTLDVNHRLNKGMGTLQFDESCLELGTMAKSSSAMLMANFKLASRFILVEQWTGINECTNWLEVFR